MEASSGEEGLNLGRRWVKSLNPLSCSIPDSAWLLVGVLAATPDPLGSWVVAIVGGGAVGTVILDSVGS